MKILEAQNSVLSNHEVYEHLVNHQSRHKARNRRAPGNLGTIVTEVGLEMRLYGATEVLKLIRLAGAQVPTDSPEPLS